MSLQSHTFLYKWNTDILTKYIEKCLKYSFPSTFGRCGRPKVRRTVARARFALQHVHKKMRRSERHRICVVESPIRHCAEVGRFSAMLLPCGFAAGCDRTHRHGCPQQSMLRRCWRTGLQLEGASCRSSRRASWEADQSRGCQTSGCSEKK